VAAFALSAQDKPAPALSVAPLAGQMIPLLPITYITSDTPLAALLPSGNAAQMAWADSVVGAAFQMRGPEVSWILAPELRRVARRAPGMVTDPDRMGHALMRASNMDRVPDPLRSYLRSLSAMTESRMVMIPAAVRFSADSTGGVRAELVLVLADTRNGSVRWRSNPSAVAATPAAALEATVAYVLPDIN
jgi:hypothetical protein